MYNTPLWFYFICRLNTYWKLITNQTLLEQTWYNYFKDKEHFILKITTNTFTCHSLVFCFFVFVTLLFSWVYKKRIIEALLRFVFTRALRHCNSGNRHTQAVWLKTWLIHLRRKQILEGYRREEMRGNKGNLNGVA